MRRVLTGALFVFATVFAAAATAVPIEAQQAAAPTPQLGTPLPTGQPGTGLPGQRGGGPPTAPPPGPSTAPPRGAWAPPAQNIRIDVTITDAADQTSKKVVSMLVADGDNGRIRSGNNQGVLNVDGRPQLVPDGRVYLSITIEYMPDRAANTTTLNESISVVITPGKPTLVSQSADPGSDRRVSVEVTATVVK
jgi:hypothetical protein